MGALAGPEDTAQKMPGHVSVAQDDGHVTLTKNDSEAVFDKEKGFWTVRWKWAEGEAPIYPIGTGIGEYSKRRLPEEQEAKFRQEIAMWVKKGWFVPYTVGQHGPVLPLLLVCQEHKATLVSMDLSCLCCRSVKNIRLRFESGSNDTQGRRSSIFERNILM